MTAPWPRPRPRPGSHLLLPALLLCLPARAHSSNQTPAAPPAVTPVEDTALEDTLARTFEQRRAAAHLRHLSRLNDRPFLREIVCSAAATGTPPSSLLAAEAQADSALFSLTGAESPPPAFNRVAEYDDRRTASGRKVARYSIAVFTSPALPGQHWVGVALYWSRFTQWLAVRSSTYAHPVTNGVIAPPCTELR